MGNSTAGVVVNNSVHVLRTGETYMLLDYLQIICAVRFIYDFVYMTGAMCC